MKNNRKATYTKNEEIITCLQKIRKYANRVEKIIREEKRGEKE